jgi:hypothetical protein
MNSVEFCIWFKGFIDASNHHNLTPAAWQIVKDNLNSVFEREQNWKRYAYSQNYETTTLTPKKEVLND